MDPVHNKGVHGPGPYFDGPGPWTRSTEGVHGPGVHVLYFPLEESVLLGTKPLVDSIRHFIQDPSGVFSVCHLCECRIVQWRHDSRLLLLLNWFLYIIKRTLQVGSKIWIFLFSWQEQCLARSLRSPMRYCSCHSNMKFISSRHRHSVISSIYPGVK